MHGSRQRVKKPPGRVRYAAGMLRDAASSKDITWLGIALACGLAASVLAASAPLALKYLIEALPGGRPEHGQIAGVAAPAVWLAAYVCALLAGRAAGEVRGVLFGSVEQSISRRLGRRAFAHTLALPMKFHLGRSTGALVQTMDNGLQGYRLILQHSLFTILPGFIEIGIIAVLVLHYLEPVFLLVFCACAAAYTLVFADGARRVLRASRAVSEARIEASTRMSDGLLNLETVKAFCGEETITRRYDIRLAKTQDQWRSFYRARFENSLLVALIFCASLAVTLWLAADRIKTGAMTIGELVLVNAWMIQIVRPLELLGVGIRDIGQGVAYVERLNALLREQSEAPAMTESRPSAELGEPPSIRFENVSFSYTAGRKILDDVSFEMEAGKVTALVGPSGSGKSSIIRLLMRLYDPDEGRILINGVDIRNYETADVRKMMAVVSQDVSLFNESLAFNVSFPEDPPNLMEIDRAMRRVDLDGVVGKLIGGLAASAGERGLKLSGGEKQRIAVARALIKRRRIFLGDEVSSALDPRTERVISSLAAMVPYEITSLVISHRLSTVEHADKIIVLAEGRIVEQGRHQELCAIGGLYAEMRQGYVL